MKSLFHKTIVLVLLAGLATSCFDKSSPNYQYFPDMYEPIGYESYGEYEVFENGQSAKLPVEGTIPRGWRPYDFENTTEGMAQAKGELTNPLPYTQDNLASGQQLYTIYCALCHGDTGNGQGILVQREKILGVPSYDDMGRAITEGSTYHVMYYGLNSMGSYASQTSEEERWQIAHYVMQLKAALEGNPEREFDEEGNENLIPDVNERSNAEGDNQESAQNVQPQVEEESTN